MLACEDAAFKTELIRAGWVNDGPETPPETLTPKIGARELPELELDEPSALGDEAPGGFDVETDTPTCTETATDEGKLRFGRDSVTNLAVREAETPSDNATCKEIPREIDVISSPDRGDGDTRTVIEGREETPADTDAFKEMPREDGNADTNTGRDSLPRLTVGEALRGLDNKT